MVRTLFLLVSLFIIACHPVGNSPDQKMLLTTPRAFSFMTAFRSSDIFVQIAVNGNPAKTYENNAGNWQIPVNRDELNFDGDNTYSIRWFENFNSQTLLLSEQTGTFFANNVDSSVDIDSTHVTEGTSTFGVSFDADVDGISNINERRNGTNPYVTVGEEIISQGDRVMCWHGRSGYEYLIAYPKSRVETGISLGQLLNTSPWDGSIDDIANDSLKMCTVDGIWYGEPDPNDWFPTVSYMKLVEGGILVCLEDASCSIAQWTMTPGDVAPSFIQHLYRNPIGNEPQVLGFTESI